jgi:lysophospholipase L1-like esterase
VRLPQRKLEFIGDSITCGFGNEASTMDPANVHYTSRGSNGHLAYGAVTASLLDAQYSAVAYSGRGVWRNYAGSGGAVLPELYSKSVPEDAAASAWSPTQYVPDAIIINLGTNDFSVPGVDHAAFTRSYSAFLATLREQHPRAALVAVLGPMLSDSYPPGENALSNAQADVKAAIAERAAAGDRNLHLLVVSPQTGPWGEDWHPTVLTHRKLAEALSAKLKEILGW